MSQPTQQGTSPRDQIAALVSELNAEAVRLTAQGQVKVFTRYSAHVDRIDLQVFRAACSGIWDQTRAQLLFEGNQCLCGYSEDPDGIRIAEREAIVTLNNWLGYLRQLEQQLAA